MLIERRSVCSQVPSTECDVSEEQGFLGDGFRPFDAQTGNPFNQFGHSPIVVYYSFLADAIINSDVSATHIGVDCAFGLLAMLRQDFEDYITFADARSIGVLEEAALLRTQLATLFSSSRTDERFHLQLVVSLDHQEHGATFTIDVLHRARTTPMLPCRQASADVGRCWCCSCVQRSTTSGGATSHLST